jgi:uncharacterized coiled-coil protein SlyX
MFAMGPESNIEVLQNRIIILSAKVAEQSQKIEQLEAMVQGLLSKVTQHLGKEEWRDNNDS